MNNKNFAVFVHGFDGIDKALTVINNINKINVNLHLYTYNSSVFPNFFSATSRIALPRAVSQPSRILAAFK